MMCSDGKKSTSSNSREAPAEKPLWLGHRKRLRQRMEREGWDSLKPHEMVELILYHAVPRQDIEEVSRALVARFGSVGGVFSASEEELRSVKGVTAAMAEWMAITGRLMRAYHGLHASRELRLTCYQEVLRFLRPIAERLSASPLWMITTDFDFNLMALKPAARSACWWDAANVRWMVTEAVTAGAKYVFLVRLTDALPMETDEERAARLESIANTLRAAEVELVDCVLAGSAGFRSMNKEGWMQNIRAESGNLALHERYAEEDGGE